MLYTARSHVGLVRQMNQDSFVVERVGEQTLVVVADGMGGAAAGEIASQMAAQVVVREVQSRLEDGEDKKTALRAAIEQANQEIWQRSQSDVDCLGMGTTLVTALYDATQVVLGHVGDSRAYRYHSGKLEQITRDHSLVAELVRRGQITENEALSHPQRNVVTRSLGTAKWSEPEIDTFTWETGDSLLLCTDGLSNCVSSEELAQHLDRLGTGLAPTVGETTKPGTTPAANRDYVDSDIQQQLEDLAEALVKLTLERGAPDNVTLVLTMHRKESGTS